MTMILALMFSAAIAATPAPAESELAAKLPEIFAKSAAHYKALDAAATPLMKDEKGEFRTPHGILTWRTGKPELDMRSIFWWTSGHYPGSLWYLYEATGDSFFKDRATVWTEILAPVSTYEGNHDVGFMMYCSYGNARRLLKTEKYDDILVETAATLAKRYHEGLGLIRSWGKADDRKDFLVIPDNLMNLELLEWAAGQNQVEKAGGGGQRSFDLIARSHADVTMRHHFRPDGGCYHVLDYDQRPGFLGTVQEIRRGQGLSCETAWSRGQAWGIYGYTMMYRFTGYVRYLDFAKKLADYAMNHPNMPADGIPYWDFGAPGEERDSSAGAVMASALLELSQYVDDNRPIEQSKQSSDSYRAFAVKQLLSLASSAYFSEGDEIGHFLLKHGVGHKPVKSEIDTPLDYGDYYFLEALLRFRELKTREAARAEVRAKLPATAKLPADELGYRSRNFGNVPANKLGKILTEPIPDTADALYGEYWTTGNRTHYQKPYFERLANLDALVAAEADEKNGRHLPRIADYLNVICDMKSWVMPAHDWPCGGRGNLRGECLTVDLGSSEYAAHLACHLQLLGDRLDAKLVRRVKSEAERRIFAPLRREVPLRARLNDRARAVVPRLYHWWTDCGMNWSAVCWDNVVCAALGLLDDADDRAFFVDFAVRSVPYYLRGFTPDGYCSEGMGYWNYGYGHHLLMGRLLRAVSDGQLDVFTTERQRKVAEYARAYTLAEGFSPAFADGNGAASKKFLGIVDSVWPDLPRDLPPASEFPDGQVWLVRDPDGLSVAFKGGHNGEFHNHNDIGSYYVVRNGQFVSGDAGGEEYTRFTFSDRRYESKVNSSYGHPVPVVGGKLQGTGETFRAKVLEKRVKVEGEGEQPDFVVLDLKGAYEVPSLKTLTRTFDYDRRTKTFTVTDRVVFSEPTAFESAYNTYLEASNPNCKVSNGKSVIGWNVRPTVSVKGGDYDVVEEDIPNPNRIAPHRVAVRMKKPVVEAEVAFVFGMR